MPRIYQNYTLGLPHQKPLQVKGYANSWLGKCVRWIRRDGLKCGGVYLKRKDLSEKFFESLEEKYGIAPSKQFKKGHPIKKELGSCLSSIKKDFKEFLIISDLSLETLESMKFRYETAQFESLTRFKQKKELLDGISQTLDRQIKSLEEEPSLEKQVRYISWVSLYCFFSFLFEQRDEEKERGYFDRILHFEGPVAPLIVPLYVKSLVYHLGEKKYHLFAEKALTITDEQFQKILKEAEKSYFPEERRRQLQANFDETIQYRPLLQKTWRKEELDLLIREINRLSSFYPNSFKKGCNKGLARALLARQKELLEKDPSQERRIAMLRLLSSLPRSEKRQKPFQDAVKTLYSEDFQKTIRRLAKEDQEHPLLEELLTNSLPPENRRPLEEREKALFKEIRPLFFEGKSDFNVPGYQNAYRKLVGEKLKQAS